MLKTGAWVIISLITILHYCIKFWFSENLDNESNFLDILQSYYEYISVYQVLISIWKLQFFWILFVEERFVTKIYFSSYFMFHNEISVSIGNACWQTARFKSFFWRKKTKRYKISGFFLMATPSVLRSESLECSHNYNLHLLKQITLLCDYSIYSLMQQKNVL